MPTASAPKGRLLFGHLADFRADRLGFFTRCARTYGDVVPLRIMGRRLALFSHPDLIEQVLVTQASKFVKHFGLRMYMPILGNGLVTSEGEFWRRQRKLAAPAFQGTRIASYAPAMVDATARMLEQWPCNGSDHVRDVHDDMMRLTLEIACRTLFGADACPEPARVGHAMHEGLQAIAVRFGRPFPIPDWFPTPANLRLRRAMRTLDGIVGGVIARRRRLSDVAEGERDGDGDLLAILLRARNDDGSAMSDAQLLDEVRTLFLAGHETTALALTYAIHLLSRSPDAQELLHAELSAVLGGRLPAHADLARLPYARKVIAESLRLYPPADVLGREAIADCTIGDVPVRKGQTIFMSPWVMHRDPRYFPDPDTFAPARWTDAFERALPRFAYFPFGGGPRYCIGQTFATAEAILLLATLCQQFAFAPDPTFSLELWPSITLRPRNGVRVRAQRRIYGHRTAADSH
jgi:cytochrome P450